jgi:hypothetical protein
VCACYIRFAWNYVTKRLKLLAGRKKSRGMGQERSSRKENRMSYDSNPLSLGRVVGAGAMQEETSREQKELVEDLKGQWKSLWSERVDDRVRAEGIATQNYSLLFIEKGTVIHATRNFKVLSFKEVLEQNQIQNPQRYIPPDPKTGGWGKFVKTHITTGPRRRSFNRALYEPIVKVQGQQLKKGGRGWLHK